MSQEDFDDCSSADLSTTASTCELPVKYPTRWEKALEHAQVVAKGMLGRHQVRACYSRRLDEVVRHSPGKWFSLGPSSVSALFNGDFAEIAIGPVRLLQVPRWTCRDGHQPKV